MTCIDSEEIKTRVEIVMRQTDYEKEVAENRRRDCGITDGEDEDANMDKVTNLFIQESDTIFSILPRLLRATALPETAFDLPFVKDEKISNASR